MWDTKKRQLYRVDPFLAVYSMNALGYLWTWAHQRAL